MQQVKHYTFVEQTVPDIYQLDSGHDSQTVFWLAIARRLTWEF